jgi:hypothetical protein
MPRSLRGPTLLSLLALDLVAGLACGGSVVVDAPAGTTLAPPDASVAPPDASLPPDPPDASLPPDPPDASIPPDPPDAGFTGCDDPTLCSLLQTHAGCYGPTTVGAYCDSLATPCAATLPDCTAVGAFFGAPAMPGSCGGGLMTCSVDWTGTVDATMLGQLCAARDAFMVRVDCLSE